MPTFDSYAMNLYAQGGGYGELSLQEMTVDGGDSTVMVDPTFYSSSEELIFYFDSNGSEVCHTGSMP